MPLLAEHRVYPLDATASSYLHSRWRAQEADHHPRYALDDDPRTGWREGAPGQGEGERLTLVFEPISQVSAITLRIHTGDQRSPERWLAEPAPRLLRVSVVDDRGRVRIVQAAELERVQGWQEVEIVGPELTLASLTLEIASSSAGTGGQDASIADVGVWVQTPAPPEAPASQAELQAWFDARRAAAQNPSWAPVFAAGTFLGRPERELPGCPDPAAFDAALARAADAERRARPRQIVSKRAAVGAPEFLRAEDEVPYTIGPLDDVLELLDARALELRAATGAPPPQEREQTILGTVLTVHEEARVVLGERGEIRAIVGKKVVSVPSGTAMRPPTLDHVTYVVLYRRGLASEVVWRSGSAYDVEAVDLLRFHHDAAGRIDGVERVTRVREGSEEPYRWSADRAVSP